ncbi:MAG: hypothetical protein RLZZ174_1104, partial [Pseudomonadota bacterium]
PYFDVDYALEPLSPVLWQGWKTPRAPAGLRLPAPNPFVPEALALIDVPEAGAPRVLAEGPWGTLWHAPDTTFEAPRAEVRLKLEGTASADAAGQVRAALWTALLARRLNSYAYPAQLAGLGFALSPTDNGVLIRASGFSDRLPELLDRVLASLKDPSFTAEAFELERAALLRRLQNERQDRPYQQTMRALQQLLEHGTYPLEARLAAAEAVTLKSVLSDFAEALLAAPKMTGLLLGNLAPEDGTRLQGIIAKHLGTAPGQAGPEPAVVRLEDGDQLLAPLAIDHDDAAFALYVQGRTQSLGERVRFGLLGHMLSPAYFNALRTEQQLGYVVSAGAFVRRNTPGLYFLVQSPVAGPEQLLGATTTFLQGYGETIANLDAARFETEKLGLRNRLLERDKNLGERAGRLWENLEAGRRDFALREALAEALDALTLEQYQAFFEVFLRRLDAQRVVAFSPGRFQDAPAPAGTAVEDVAAFKAARGRFLLTGGTP